jgi:cell division protein ZapA
MKQIEVTILGQSYLLGCPEGADAALQAAVRHVDQEMSAIKDAGRVKARERIAVLAALNLAYALGQKESINNHGTTPTHTKNQSSSEVLDDALDRLISKIDQALHQE